MSQFPALSSYLTKKPEDTGNFGTQTTTPNLVAKPILPQIVSFAQKAGTAVKEFALPNRGFTDTQISTATPTLGEKFKGVAKVGAEIVGGLSSIGQGILRSLPIPQPKADTVLADKIRDFATPKTAGEAKVMRFADIAGFLPIGSVKNYGKIVGTIAKSKNADEIATLLTKTGVAKENIPAMSKVLVGVDNPQQVNSLINSSQKAEGLLPKRLQATETLDTKLATGETQSLKVPIKPNQPTSPLISSYEKNVPQDFNPDKYVKEQIQARGEAKNTGVGILSKAKSFLQDAKSKLVDSTAPIEDTLAKAEKKNKISFLPEDNIHNQIDRVLRAPTLAGQFAKDNGIVDVIKGVDNIDNLDQYLIAKHAIELDTRGITTGRDMAKDTALVKAFGTKYEKEAQVISQYSQKLLDYSVETGLISEDLAKTLKQRYPDYVPFQRVFNELEKTNGFGAGGVASLSKQSIVQKIEGSVRQVESPIESLLSKTNDAFRQGEKNLAGKMLASYEKLPGNPFQIKEVLKGESAQHTISFLENGVKKTFETTKEIADAAKSINVQQLNILGKIFALPVRVARVGITGINLPFVGANIVKDQVSAFINSNHGLKTSIANPVNFISSLFSAVGHGKLYEEMVRAGGAGTSFDIARNQVEQTVSRIRAGRSIGSKIVYSVRHPSELLRAVENIIGRSEELTRIQQYRGTKQALLTKGASEKSAIAEGARAARDSTVNFARRGEWGTVLNSAFLYLNASIQGTRTLLRNLKTKPVATSAKIAISALYPVALATTWNLSDPKRKQAYEDMPEYEKENNIIIIPSNPTQDENGKWNVIKIPLSQEINNLVSMARKPIEQAHGLDPVTFQDFAQSFLGTISPINPTKGSVLSTLTPQAIKPTLEGAVNQSLFTGIPQVPQSLSKLSPEKQAKPYTSGTAIQIGEKLHLSPIKVEEFIKGTFGGVGSQALHAVDVALNKVGVIPADQVHGQKILDAISARFSKASGGAILNKQYEAENIAAQQKADTRAGFKIRVYDKAQALLKAGDTEGADTMVQDLSPEEQKIYKGIKTGEHAKNTTELHRLLAGRNSSKAVEFVRSQPEREKERLMELLNNEKNFTDEERALYVKGKESL